MKTNNKDIDFFGDGMSIFLDYISRQLKKNENYKPHPIIRAFECALQGIEGCKSGRCTMGVSQDGAEGNIHQSYIVVLQKNNNGIEVKEIRNLIVDKLLPTDIMVLIFRLQIHLDKIEGDTVGPLQMVEVLNKIIPGNKFYALGDRWIEARDIFQENMKKGKVYFPEDFKKNGLLDELLSIKYNTPWENYSNNLRAFIGSSIIEKLEDKKTKIIITSPTNSKIKKYNVFDSAIEFMMGRSAEYLKPDKEKGK